MVVSLLRTGLLFVWVGAVGCGMMSDPGATDVTKGLLGYWAFEGNVSDGSARGNDGVAVGEPGFGDGKIGMAVTLDGESQCVEVPALASAVTQLTIAAWIYVEKMPAPQKFASIYHNNGWKAGDVHLPFAGEEGIMDLGIKGNEPDMSVPSFKVKDLQGRWVHLAVSYDADDKKEVWFYLDGQPTEAFKIEKANPANLGPGRIGAWDDEGRWFNGRIDEVYIYERSLPAREIAMLFELGSDTR